MFERIAENLAGVQERIRQAATRSGRSSTAVTLVAVTKYVGPEAARALIAAGCNDLGESRPQELWDKAASIHAPQLRWHMIGHLQRNKLRRTLPLVSLTHSVDSERLLVALEEEAAMLRQTVAVLLEVNISGEAAKHGFQADDLEPLVARAKKFSHLAIRGLMGMSGLNSDADEARREFSALRQLRDRLQPQCPAGVSLAELSMGMSHDFEAAIGEGATIVRIGSALFEGIET